jgi:hypothetical protein
MTKTPMLEPSWERQSFERSAESFRYSEVMTMRFRDLPEIHSGSLIPLLFP